MNGIQLIIILGALYQIPQAKRINRPRQEASALSHGLIFSPSDKDLLIEAGHWQHVFQINIPEQSDIVQFDKYPFVSGWSPFSEPSDNEKYSTYTDIEELNNHANSLRTNLLNQYQTFKNRTDKLFPNYRDKPRQKRGLIDISGLLNYLFTVPSSADMDNLKHITQERHEKDVETIDTIRLDSDKMISHMNITDQMIISLATNANATVNTLNNMTRQLRSMDDAYNHLSSRSTFLAQFALSFSQSSATLNKFQQHLDNLIRHQISPDLITPSTILDVFAAIKVKLKNLNTKYTIDTDLTHFYENKNFKVQRLHNSIFVFVQFSMTYASPKDYELYTIRQNPLPLTSHQSDQKHDWASQVKLTNEAMLVVLPKRSVYAILTQQELNLCQVTQTRIICDFPVVMKEFSFPTCIYGIFSNNARMIKDKCQFQFTMAGIEPDISYLGHNKLLATNVSRLKFECAHQTYSIDLPNDKPAIIDINGCACLIQDTRNGQMLPAFIECTDDQPEPTHILTNNILPHLLTPQEIKQMGQQAITSGTLDLPPIATFPANDILKTAQTETYSLNKLLQESKEQEKLFKNPADKALDHTVRFITQARTNQIAPYFTVGAIIILIGSQAFQAVKMYRLYALVTILANPTKAQDESINLRQLETPTEITVYDHMNAMANYANNNVLLVLALCATIYVSYRLLHWLRNSQSKLNCNWNRASNTTIYASMASKDKNILIKWQSFKILSHRLQLPPFLVTAEFTIDTIIPLLLYRIRLTTVKQPTLIVDSRITIRLNQTAYITTGLSWSITRLKSPRTLSFIYRAKGDFKLIPIYQALTSTTTTTDILIASSRAPMSPPPCLKTPKPHKLTTIVPAPPPKASGIDIEKVQVHKTYKPRPKKQRLHSPPENQTYITVTEI